MRYLTVLLSSVLLVSSTYAGEPPPSVYARTPLIQSKRNPDPPVTKYVQVIPQPVYRLQANPSFQGGAVSGITRATTAPYAVTVPGKLTSYGGTVQNGEPTYTLAPSMGLGGITSGGCSGGNCPTPSMQRRGLFGR